MPLGITSSRVTRRSATLSPGGLSGTLLSITLGALIPIKGISARAQPYLEPAYFLRVPIFRRTLLATAIRKIKIIRKTSLLFRDRAGEGQSSLLAFETPPAGACVSS